MDAHVYAVGSTFILPGIARAPAGFVVEVEPVQVVPEATIESMTAALEHARTRIAATAAPGTERNQEPVVLRHAGVRSMKEFERRARLWIVTWAGDRATLMPTNALVEGGWEDAVDRAMTYEGRQATQRVAEELLNQAPASRR